MMTPRRKSESRRTLGSVFPLVLLTILSVVLAGRLEAGSSLDQTANNPGRVVMGYYPSWARSSFSHLQIEYKALTHIAQAFTWPDADGNLVVPGDYLYPELVQAAHENQVSMIMSVGGWGNCEGFGPMASRESTRQKFIGQVVEFCRDNEYDGVDIDWEFVVGEEQRANFSLLIRELGSALKAMNPPRLLSMAAPAGEYYGQWIPFEELHPFFDYIGFMTYDFHGPWTDHSGHNSPLYPWADDQDGSVDQTFAYARSRQVPLDKLLLGAPFYGRSFDCGRLSQSFKVSRYIPFAQAVEYWQEGWSYHWDGSAKVPYLVNPAGTEILCFDDIFSIACKCRYILDKNAAGIIIWELSQDSCQGTPFLIKVIGLLLRGIL